MISSVQVLTSNTITYSCMHRIDSLHLQDISLISLNAETSLVNSSFEKKEL